MIGIGGAHYQRFLGDVVRIAELDLVGATLGVGQIGKNHVNAAHFDFRNARFDRQRLELQLDAHMFGQRLAEVNIHAYQFTGFRVRCRKRRDVSIDAATQAFLAHHITELISVSKRNSQWRQCQCNQQRLHTHGETPGNKWRDC